MINVKSIARIPDEGARRFEGETAATDTETAIHTEREGVRILTVEEDSQLKKITSSVTTLSRDSRIALEDQQHTTFQSTSSESCMPQLLHHYGYPLAVFFSFSSL
uniref:Uncharacterized protein n=1 Tax=Photinus pyralis TaxID=7054 RepID=A0A1Y1KEH8_PHOPY